MLQVEQNYWNGPVTAIVAEKVFKKWRGAEPDEQVVAEKLEHLKKEVSPGAIVMTPVCGHCFMRALLLHSCQWRGLGLCADHAMTLTYVVLVSFTQVHARGGLVCNSTQHPAPTPPDTCLQVFPVYEAHLGSHQFLAGDQLSLADISHAPYTQVGGWVGGQPCPAGVMVVQVTTGLN
jgi:hypothetical protein